MKPGVGKLKELPDAEAAADEELALPADVISKQILCPPSTFWQSWYLFSSKGGRHISHRAPTMQLKVSRYYMNDESNAAGANKPQMYL